MSSSVIPDLKRNVLYITDQLKGVKIELKTDEGKFLTLHDFYHKAMHRIAGEGNKQSKEVKVPTGVIATLLGLEYIPGAGMYVSQQGLRTFCAGFELGVLFERLRTKRNLTISTEDFELNAAEMDAVLNAVDTEEDAHGDSEE